MLQLKNLGVLVQQFALQLLEVFGKRPRENGARALRTVLLRERVALGKADSLEVSDTRTGTRSTTNL